jgi:proprotein convertase subtilisin/kexin type 5
LYGDDDTRLCQKCDTSCGTCTGPLQADCLTCNFRLGYAQKGTQCQKVVCQKGTYMQVDNFTKLTQCLSCMPQCESCDARFPFYCTKCGSNFMDFPVEDHNGYFTCKTCEDFVGFKTGIGGSCEGIFYVIMTIRNMWRRQTYGNFVM